MKAIEKLTGGKLPLASLNPGQPKQDTYSQSSQAVPGTTTILVGVHGPVTCDPAQEKALNDIEGLRNRVLRGTQLASKEAERLARYRPLFDAVPQQQAEIDRILHKNTQQTATQKATALRNRQMADTPLTAQELEQLERDRALFDAGADTLQMIDAIVSENPATMVRQGINELLKKAQAGIVLGAKELAALQELTSKTEATTPAGQKAQAVSDLHLYNLTKKQQVILSDNQWDQLSAALNRDSLTDPRKAEVRKLLTGRSITRLEESARHHAGKLPEADVKKLFALQMTQENLSNSQKGRIFALLRTWSDAVLLPGFKTLADLERADLKRLIPGYNPAGSESPALAGLLKELWVNSFLSAQTTVATETINFNTLGTLWDREDLDPKTRAKIKELYTQNAEITINALSKRLEGEAKAIPPYEVQRLAGFKPAALSDQAIVSIQKLLTTTFKTLQSQEIEAVDHAIQSHQPSDLIAREKKFMTTHTSLQGLAQAYHCETEAQQCRDTVLQRIGIFKGFHFRNDGTFYQLHDRVGAPLAQVRLATYNVKELHVPDPLSEVTAPSEEKRFHQLAERIRETRANVMVLQEVHGLKSLGLFLDKTGLNKEYPNVIYVLPDKKAADKIKERLGDQTYEIPGIVILAKNDVEIPQQSIEHLNNLLRKFPDGVRPIVECKVDSGNHTPITLEALHLKANHTSQMATLDDCGSIRERELGTLKNRVKTLTEGPVVAMGDFNDKTCQVEGMIRAKAVNEDRVGTFIYSKHTERHNSPDVLDQFFLKNAVITEEPEILTTEHEPSDHRPVVIGIKAR